MTFEDQVLAEDNEIYLARQEEKQQLREETETCSTTTSTISIASPEASPF